MRSVLPIVCLILSGCASAWPEPRVTYFHAASANDADRYIRGRTILNPMLYEAKAVGTSNGPRFADKRTRWINEIAVGRKWTQDDVGLMVVFYTDSGLTIRHQVVAVNKSGDALLTAGLANRHNDGWIPASRVIAILREGVTSL